MPLTIYKMTHAECKSKRVKWQALQDEINGCLHWWQLMLEDVVPSEICKRASGAITTYALAQILWDWETYEHTVATNVFANQAMKTHSDHNNDKQTSEEGFICHQFLTALRFQSFWTTEHDREESLSPFLCGGEWTGGRDEREQEGRKKKGCAL